MLAGQWAPVSVLLAPVLYDAGNSISSQRWKIHLDGAFPFLLRILTHPGKRELLERGRSSRGRHPEGSSPVPAPSRSARRWPLPEEETGPETMRWAGCLSGDPPTGAIGDSRAKSPCPGRPGQKRAQREGLPTARRPHLWVWQSEPSSPAKALEGTSQVVPRFTKPLASIPLVSGLGVCLAWGRPGAGWEWGYLFNPQHQQRGRKKCLPAHLGFFF